MILMKVYMYIYLYFRDTGGDCFCTVGPMSGNVEDSAVGRQPHNGKLSWVRFLMKHGAFGFILFRD